MRSDGVLTNPAVETTPRDAHVSGHRVHLKRVQCHGSTLRHQLWENRRKRKLASEPTHPGASQKRSEKVGKQVFGEAFLKSL